MLKSNNINYMNFSFVKTCIFGLLLLVSLNISAQKFGAGGAVIYNLQTKSFGIDLRGEFPELHIIHRLIKFMNSI